MIRCLLIDPALKLVYCTSYPDGMKYPDPYRHFGVSPDGHIETIGLPTGRDVIYVDEEGLLRQNPGPFFQIEGVYENPIAGIGLVVGITPGGDNTHTTLDPTFFQGIISFPDVEFIGMDYSEGVEYVPGFGSMPVFRSVARFRPRGKIVV